MSATVSCFLVDIVSPLMGKSSTYVKISAHFVEKICKAPIHSNNVVSLFLRIPTDKTQTVGWDKLAADFLLEECTCITKDNLMKMLTFFVKMTYFRIVSDIYRQKEGLVIESLVSTVIVNIYIEYSEEIALRSTSLKLSL